ncbi:YgaP-like transmembrane domain [Algoriphagus jejuensis]
MKINMGRIDRSVRLLIASVLNSIYFSGVVTGFGRL